MRARAIANPAIPMAVVIDLNNLGLNLRILVLFAAFRLLRIRHQIGPHPRDRSDSFAVGKPANAGDTGRQFRDATRLAPIGCYDVELRLIVAISLSAKGDGFSVGRPLRRGVLFARAGELFARFSVRAVQPQLGGALVGLHRESGLVDNHPLAIGRHARCAKTLALPEVLDGQVFCFCHSYPIS